MRARGNKRYAIGAAVADWYVLNIGLGAAVALYVAATRRPVPPWEPLALLALTLAMVLVYHGGLARRSALLSPGELMMGRSVVDGVKQWRNPHGIGRGALFGVLYVALVMAGNSWDMVADEELHATLAFHVTLGRMTLLSFLLHGLISLGRGQPGAGVLVAAYFAAGPWGMIETRPPVQIAEQVIASLGAFCVLMAVATVVVVLRYGRAVAMLAPQGSQATAAEVRH